MTKKICLLIISLSLIFFSCKKHQFTVLYKINFINHEISSSKGLAMEKKGLSSDRYTQFGDYITSITPKKFTAHIWTVGYIDRVLDRSNNNANNATMLQYIDQNGEKLSPNDPSRSIDFSDNNIVNFDPVIYGNINNDGQFVNAPIDFKYFYFIPYNLYQELQLPPEYQNVTLDMFPSGSVTDNMLKINHNQILNKLFPNAGTSRNLYLIFGNTDSTFIVNPNGESVGFSEDCPIAEPGHDLTIRSNKYVNMIFNQPAEGETTVMNGILSINTQDLIQIYAGADNVPYTRDDIFVYAPRFWERISSRLDIN